MNRLRMHPNTCLAILVTGLTLVLSGCAQALPEISVEGFAMDSYYRVGVSVAQDSADLVGQWVRGELTRLEERYDIFDVTPEPSPDDPETQMLRSMAATYTRISEGAYRVDIAPLSKIWHAAIASGQPPSADEITEALAIIKTGAAGLDFGSLLKGYAADQVYTYLRSAGVGKALIDMGGTIRVLGRPSLWRREWRVAVRNPLGSGTLGYFELVSGQAIATSGDYERGFRYQGQYYHHLLDPRTGYPAGEYQGVSVVAPDALSADILSTLLFITGPAGVARVEAQTGVAIKVLFVDKEGKIEMSGSLVVPWVKNEG